MAGRSTNSRSPAAALQECGEEKNACGSLEELECCAKEERVPTVDGVEKDAASEGENINESDEPLTEVGESTANEESRGPTQEPAATDPQAAAVPKKKRLARATRKHLKKAVEGVKPTAKLEDVMSRLRSCRLRILFTLSSLKRFCSSRAEA